MKIIYFSYLLTVLILSLSAQDRRPFHPFITGDGFRACADHIYDETTNNNLFNPSTVKHGEIIFVKTDLIWQFFEKIHPAILSKYILITHNSDYCMPGDLAKFLEDEKLIAWFAQNVTDCIHKKLIPIPIGLENRYNSHGDHSIIKKAIETVSKNKEILLFLNFTANNYPQERLPIINLFKNEPYCKYCLGLTYTNYLQNLAKSWFVLSPRGNGWDCHRTWESLYMGSIPIVKHSASDTLFDNLPVYIVKEWNEINEELLEEKLLEVQNIEYDWSKLDMAYWINMINSYKEQV